MNTRCDIDADHFKMELPRSVPAMIATLILLNGYLCHSQEVFFNLKDPESNEVISAGQENITLVCYVSNTMDANIMILNGAGETVVSQTMGNCLEYTIPRLSGINDGDYMCRVSYVDGTTGTENTLMRSLVLNVESGDQQCFRNGTSQQAYQIGDTLQLSCYCTSTNNCQWIKTVVGSQEGEAIPVYETVEIDSNRRIIRVIVTMDDLDTRYDCAYGPTTNERCSIGPKSTSSGDRILNPIDLSRVVRECPKIFSTTPMVFTSRAPNGVVAESMTQVGEVPQTTHKSASTPVTTEPSGKDEDANGSGPVILYTLNGAGILLILLALLILCIVVANRRNGKGQSSEAHRRTCDSDSGTNAASVNDGYETPDNLHRSANSDATEYDTVLNDLRQGGRPPQRYANVHETMTSGPKAAVRNGSDDSITVANECPSSTVGSPDCYRYSRTDYDDAPPEYTNSDRTVVPRGFRYVDE